MKLALQVLVVLAAIGGLTILLSQNWAIAITKAEAERPAERPVFYAPYVGAMPPVAATLDSKSRICPTRNFAQEYVVKYQESSRRVAYDERGSWAIGLGLAFVADALVWCK